MAVRTDILPTTEEQTIIVQNIFNEYILKEGVSALAAIDPKSSRSTSWGQAKRITDFPVVVKEILEDVWKKEGLIDEAKVIFTEEEPDRILLPSDERDMALIQNLSRSQTSSPPAEVITFRITERRPGQASRGAPGSSGIQNLKPLHRETVPDPDHPGYRMAIFGFWYDTWVRLTCWALTNKEANKRAVWLEDIMQEYQWYFTFKGFPRVLYQGRSTDDETKKVKDSKIYGRHIDFYVRDEYLLRVSEKTVERMYLSLEFRSS